MECHQPIRAVLLDLDGTLLDHALSSAVAVVGWVHERGRWHLPDAHTAGLWLEIEARHYLRCERGELTHQEQRRERLREFMPELFGASPDVLDEVYAGFLRWYEESWIGFPDAAPSIQALQDAGYEVGILTNGTLSQQTAKMRRLGLSQFRLPVFASLDLGHPKPHPQAYITACYGLNVPPAQTVMVGDHHINDVHGALQAGLQAVHLRREDVGQASTEAPEISSLLELPELLCAMSGGVVPAPKRPTATQQRLHQAHRASAPATDPTNILPIQPARRFA